MMQQKRPPFRVAGLAAITNTSATSVTATRTSKPLGVQQSHTSKRDFVSRSEAINPDKRLSKAYCAPKDFVSPTCDAVLGRRKKHGVSIAKAQGIATSVKKPHPKAVKHTLIPRPIPVPEQYVAPTESEFQAAMLDFTRPPTDTEITFPEAPPISLCLSMSSIFSIGQDDTHASDKAQPRVMLPPPNLSDNQVPRAHLVNGAELPLTQVNLEQHQQCRASTLPLPKTSFQWASELPPPWSFRDPITDKRRCNNAPARRDAVSGHAGMLNAPLDLVRPVRHPSTPLLSELDSPSQYSAAGSGTTEAIWQMLFAPSYLAMSGQEENSLERLAEIEVGESLSGRDDVAEALYYFTLAYGSANSHGHGQARAWARHLGSQEQRVWEYVQNRIALAADVCLKHWSDPVATDGAFLGVHGLKGCWCERKGVDLQIWRRRRLRMMLEQSRYNGPAKEVVETSSYF